MSSNARKIPAEVLNHPAVVSLIDRARPTGRVTPEEVRQATEQAAVEPRHLKALLGHLSTLGISVDLGAPGPSDPGPVRLRASSGISGCPWQNEGRGS